MKRPASLMILDHPVIRLALKAMSACGLIGDERASATGRDSRGEPRDSPFVLVMRAPDGSWGVYQRDFDTPLVSFEEMVDACDRANEIARTRAGAMVLIGKRQAPDAASGP